MKIINMKGLVQFAASGGLPDKTGYLLKRGDVNRGFQKRWFVLKGNLLFYYEKECDREPAGMIILEGCVIEVAQCENIDNYAFQISFPGSGARTYVLSASSQDELESWMRALSRAPYDYAKLVVAELEQQLFESTIESAKIIQAAEREGKILNHTYSEDTACMKFCSRPQSSEHVRSLLDNSVGASAYQFQAQTKWNQFSDMEGLSSSDLVANRGRSMSTLQPVSITTWRMLGIFNFYEMHDEVKRQIREFSSDS